MSKRSNSPSPTFSKSSSKTTRSTAIGKSRLIYNRRGRIFFLGLTLIWFLLDVFANAVIMMTWKTFPGLRAWAIVAIVCVTLTWLWTGIMTFSQQLFRWRGPNIVLYLILGILMAISTHKCDGPWTFEVPAVVVCGLQFFMVVALVPSSQSRTALYLHPFVDERLFIAESGRGRHPYYASTDGGKGPRKISIFRDWPAPIPFPAKALYSYPAKSNSELNFHKGDSLTILDCRGNWWQARHPGTGGVGYVPSNFISVLQRAKVVKSFTASGADEINIIEGQMVEIMEQHENMSLIRGPDARIGSVFSDCLQPLPVEESTSTNMKSGRTQSPGEKDKENLPPPKVSIVKGAK